MNHNLDDYDYDNDDPNSTAYHYDEYEEGYLTPTYHWDSTFPGGGVCGRPKSLWKTA